MRSQPPAVSQPVGAAYAGWNAIPAPPLLTIAETTLIRSIPARALPPPLAPPTLFHLACLLTV